MSEEVSSPLDDFVVTLEYTIKEVNALLGVLAEVPFAKSYMAINSVQVQVAPQFEKAKASLEAAIKASKEKSDEPKAAS